MLGTVLLAFIVHDWTIIAFTGLGILSIFNLIDRRGAQIGTTSEKVIKLLNEQVSALEEKVNRLEEQIADSAKQIAILISENRTLKEVFQGRDKSTQDYQRLGIETMTKTVPQIFDLVKATSNSVNKLVNAIDGLVKALNIKTTVTTTTQSVAP